MMRPIPLTGEPISADRLCRQLRVLIAVAGLILIDQTRPLWFGSFDAFPRVPLFSWFLAWPNWWDWSASGLMVLGLLGLFFFRPDTKFSPVPCLIYAAGFALAVSLNQHRLQPWAFEFFILLMVMALLPADRAALCLRFFVASIYLHSGLSKLDATFLATHGETFVSVITNTVGWDFAQAPDAVKKFLVALLPLGEIAVAVGFCFARRMRIAKWCSVLMHLLLLWILGPWGLDHQPGVLIWNVFFIFQNLILFHTVGSAVRTIPQAHPQSLRSAQRTLLWGYAFTAGAILLPFLEPFGLYDHWPAWAVYASRPERTRVFVAENRVADLPDELQSFVVEDEEGLEAAERFLAGDAPWRRFRIDRWSLETLHAPLYPQDRFQVGVALWLAEEYDLGEDIRVEIDSPAERFTGERTTRIIEGTASIRDLASEYRLNALPR